MKILLTILMLAATSHAADIYIAPNGNDTNPGTRDKPFATLHRALAAKDRDTIILRGGTYFLDTPLVLGPEHNGLTIAAYRDERPVISGGRRLTGWRSATNQLWVADVPSHWYFRELWVNGQRRVRARHPNTGYLSIAEAVAPADHPEWTDGQQSFRYHENDLRAWTSITNAEVVTMTRWVESRLPVTALDPATRIISFGKKNVFKLDPGDLYYIEHVFEALDSPGEWYLDRAAGKLYYRPMPGEDLAAAEVIAPVLPQLVRLENVERITFRGLTFAHAEWYYPAEFKIDDWLKGNIGGFYQAAFGVPGAVSGEGVRHCRFESCQFRNLGTYALELSRGCQSNVISRCEMADLGGGGVKLGETRKIRENVADQTFGNEISDSVIRDGGKLFHQAVGIWVGQSYNNRILHNLIHDFYYTGISIGWTWGYGPATAGGNLVEWNHIHHIGKLTNGDGPILSDMGGIYTLGKQPGTIIRNNLWHDMAAFRYGGWGIYFDEGSSDIVAENNLVYRTTHGGFHQHYGKENVVRNNIFAFARDHQIQRSRVEPHRSFNFERNIVYWDKGALHGGTWDGDMYRMDFNLYWRTDGQPVTLRQDKNSLIADPLFIAPAKGDFTLKPGSPAEKIGFKPFDLRGVGPRR